MLGKGFTSTSKTLSLHFVTYKVLAQCNLGPHHYFFIFVFFGPQLGRTSLLSTFIVSKMFFEMIKYIKMTKVDKFYTLNSPISILKFHNEASMGRGF